MGTADLWHDPPHAQHPAYAGAFVYGRVCQDVAIGDPPTTSERRLPPEEWAIVIQGVYPAFISYNTFLANRQKLKANRYNFTAKGRGAARTGVALLQGLVHCGRCGRQMGVSYGRQQPRYQCRDAQVRHAEAMCQSFVAGDIDNIIVATFLEAVRPAGLEATLAALRSLEQERQAVDRQWQLRVERAHYEARLAQRQYQAVDPDNRLVARELERHWETALAEVEKLQQDYQHLLATELRPLDVVETEDVRRLAEDLPALWKAETTMPVDRKRLLRLIIAAVTVTVRADRRGADLQILWSGGTRTTHWVDSPGFGRHLRTDAGVLETIRDLAGRMPDHQVAAALTEQGLLSRHGKPWTRGRVASMRRQHAIPTACPAQTGGITMRADGFVPAKVAARQLRITLAAIRIWAHRGVLVCDQSSEAAKLWIRLDPGDLERLRGKVDTVGMQRVREIAYKSASSVASVWDRVRRGEFSAYRVRKGRNQWDWQLASRMPAPAAAPGSQLPSAAKDTA